MSLTPSPSSTGTSLSLDTRSLDKLKYASGKDQKSAIKDTAKQLESLFMQELMKSMRATTMNSGMLENSGTEMGTSMLDSQRAQQMSGLPGGISDMIIKQLQRQLGGGDSDASADTPVSPFKGLGDLSMSKLPMMSSGKAADAALPPASAAGGVAEASNRKLSHTEKFVREHQAAAKAAENATGIPANHILGQAALESGWGKHEPKMANGQSSHNLFGIKANSSWTGKVAEVTTTEYIGGVARKVTAKFRAYDSYEDSFKDHAKLLSQSPRYSQTVAQADTAQGFARGLQKAGYATDPSYADKLTKVINTTLRLQRSVT
ncbi:MAG: flagellar assembly peptidoglycan hydrolase FlgJ [Rubrivivax sp.]|nr:MAG: flagellar assembly peptidoglycan hydrolase FlgJ [Rubrivivax sp.]